MPLVSALIIVAGLAGVAWWAVRQVRGSHLSEGRHEDRVLQLLALMAPGIAAAATDPRALLAWQPLAVTARRLFPREFSSLDGATGGTFPFTANQIQDAHSRWTAEWLAWERTHEATYKVMAAAADEEWQASERAPSMRSKVDAVEREKLDLYQQRYADYVRVAKALQALQAPPT